MNILGIVVSIVFVVGIIAICTLFEKKGLLSGEGSRKFIHIGVSNWWFIAMFYFDSPFWAALVPLLFVFVNYYSYKHQMIKSMERGGGKEDLGTVYYAISLLILAIWTFSIESPYIGGLGILAMGYGDGFAAIIGQKWPTPKLFLKKSLSGSLTVVIITTILAYVCFQMFSPSIPLYFTWVIGLIAGLLELYTPKGLDNLSLPIGVSLIYYILIHSFV